jgi:leader peptidase (prepilin peptidase) / N-methyltransferase
MREPRFSRWRGLQSPLVDPTTAARGVAVVVSALLGLLVGSFLNVVIYRVPLGMSVVRPPSHCPGCGTELGVVENVPLISWLILRARCRHCRAPISPRYPLVELVTGLTFGGTALAVGAAWALPCLLAVVASAIAAAAIDLDGPPVPWALVTAAGAGAVSMVAVAAAAGQPGRVGWAGLGGAAAALVALLADRSPRGARRAGIIAALGWSAGWLWNPGGVVLAGWVVAVALGTSLWRRRRRRDSPSGRAEGAGAVGRVGPSLVAVATGAFGLLLAGAAMAVTL